MQTPVTPGATDAPPTSPPIPPPAETAWHLANEPYCLQVAASKSYLTNLVQIPSTVIDNGVFRNVPYKSYRAGDYEMNVYGDPVQPAGVEVGVYRNLLTSQNAKHQLRWIHRLRLTSRPTKRYSLHST